MFGIGTTELMVILVVALLVLGPKKLPQVARSLGKAFGEFRRVSTDVKRTIDTEVDRLEKEERDKKARDELRGEDAKARREAGAEDKVPEKDVAPEPDAPGPDPDGSSEQDDLSATAEMDQDENKPHQDASKA